MQLGRPVFAGFIHDATHLGGGADQVEAFALHDLQRHGGVAVEARRALAILKGQADGRQIAQGHHTVVVHLDRQVIDVLQLVERGGDLNGGRARGRLDVTRRDQLIVVLHDRDQLARGDVIGFQFQRVDFDLDHLVAIASQRGF